MKRLLLAALAALVLGGCGFHLRGAMTLPSDIGEIRIVSRGKYSPLAEALALSLQRQGHQARVVEGGAAADAALDSSTMDATTGGTMDAGVPPPAGTAAAGTDAPAPAHAAATLTIQIEKWGDTPAAIDERGRAQEYTLRYATVFDLKKVDGTLIVPRQSIELSRDYVSVATSSEGTESEREILSREMQREMVASILRRIDAVTQAPQPAAANATPAPATATSAPDATPVPGATPAP